MRYIYVDLGCYNGDTVEEFKNWRKIAFDKTWEWEIYAFDANPRFEVGWLEKAIEGAHFQLAAAWTEDGYQDFAVDETETPLGSTLMRGKKEIWEHNPKIKVRTFDFPKWLEQFKDDYVVVKMDVEGAEFPILERMLDDGTITIPSLLLVEFHPNKVIEYTTTHKNELVEEIKKRGVELEEWH